MVKLSREGRLLGISTFLLQNFPINTNLNCVIAYFQISAKIKILQYTKYELTTEGETFIGFSDVTTVTADSHSLTDTVDTDCLTVAAVNRCYCRQINCEQSSYWRNRSPSIRMLVAVQYQYKNTFPMHELTPQAILIPQNFYKTSKVL